MPLNLVSCRCARSRRQLADLGGDRRLVRRRQRAVRVLHGQLADALQHRVHLVQRALSRLHQRDAVLRVALGLGEAADLATQLLADRQAGGVVGRAVDAVAGLDSRSIDLLSPSRCRTSWRWALNASTLLWMRRDIRSSSLMTFCLGSQGDSMSPLKPVIGPDPSAFRPKCGAFVAVVRTSRRRGPTRAPARARTPGMAMFHVVVRRSGPAYDPARPLEEQSGWEAHAAFMDGLVDAGFLVLGGPLEDEAAGGARGLGGLARGGSRDARA